MACSAATDDHDVRGLNLVSPDQPASDRVARIRLQLKAADAQVQVERDEAEPAEVSGPRRRGEELLGQRLYEDAEEAFLDAIDAGLAHDHFCWQAAVNVVNCQFFLRRLADADSTAAQLQDMYAGQPEHPLHYLVATQRGALAAERWAMAHASSASEPSSASEAASAAEEALTWAQAAYRWQEDYRGGADGLRAYNLVVALLRLDRRDEALALHQRHQPDDCFQAWCRQGDHAAELAELAAD